MRRFIVLTCMAVVLSAAGFVMAADPASAHDTCIFNGDYPGGEYDTACVTENRYRLTMWDGECHDDPIGVQFRVAATGDEYHYRFVTGGCGHSGTWGMLSPITLYRLCEERSDGTPYCTGWKVP